MIDRNLFFVWFGNKKPNYCDLAVSSFKKNNPMFDIFEIWKTEKDLSDIFSSSVKHPNMYDKMIKYSWDIVTGKIKRTIYNEFLEKQKRAYQGTNYLRFVLLSDIFRLELLNNMTGIYLDYDCYSVKPFDHSILEKTFCVTRHYSDEEPRPDNYFMGCDGFEKIVCPTYGGQKISRYICQTFPKWQFDVSYVKCVSAFSNGLSVDDNISEKFKKFYIIHLSQKMWSIKNKSF